MRLVIAEEAPISPDPYLLLLGWGSEDLLWLGRSWIGHAIGADDCCRSLPTEIVCSILFSDFVWTQTAPQCR